MLTCSLFIFAMNEMPHVGWRDPLVSGTLFLSALALALFVFVELRSSHADLEFFAVSHPAVYGVHVQSFFHHLDAIGDQFSHALLSAERPAVLADADGLDYYRQLGGHRLGGADCRLVVRSHGLAAALHGRIRQSLSSANFLLPHCRSDASIWRIIAPLLLIGLGWAIFNSPNQSAILGSVPRDEVGTASGMNTTTARTGGAMGVALLRHFVYLWAQRRRACRRRRSNRRNAWGDAPEIFVHSFNHTVHIVNFFTILSIFFSAVQRSATE